MRICVIDACNIKQYLNKADVILVDLREHRAYQERHIRGAISIPYDRFEAEKHRLDRKKTILLYCQRGNTSLRVAWRLSQKGYRVMSLGGGMEALIDYWKIR